MKPALCESGLLKTLFDNLGGKNTAEWHEILRRALRRENPFQDQSITFAIRLTPSMIAGTKALEELHSQGRISTTNWYNLAVEPIDNHGDYSEAHRTITFTLGNEQKVEVRVTTWKRESGDVVDGDEGRKWESNAVWIEKNGRMMCLFGYTKLAGDKPWCRWPRGDKPLSGTTWRAPTSIEIAAYHAAVANHDEKAFLQIYYGDRIAWEDLNDHLGLNTHWMEETLRKAAEREVA